MTMNRENLNSLIERAGKGIKPVCEERGIDCQLIMPNFDIFVIAEGVCYDW